MCDKAARAVWHIGSMTLWHIRRNDSHFNSTSRLLNKRQVLFSFV
ncbi:hypothetical protein CLU85_1917 [Acidovorax sp. 69]|nr:hypothetical protein CLU85_1917 [Acidovorax sp. 69]